MKASNKILYLLAGIGVAGLMFLTSCAPIKRHDRIARKYPFVHKADSVTVVDTVQIKVPEIKVDTVFLESMLYDTVTITDTLQKLTVKLWKIPGEPEKIYIKGGVKEIIVERIITRKVPVTVYEERNPWLRNLIIWVIIILVIISLLNHHRKRIIERRIIEKPIGYEMTQEE